MKWAEDLLNNKINVTPLMNFLIVEGPDDQLRYQRWLEKLDPAANTKVQVESAGNREQTLRALRWLRDSGGDPPTVFGIVDRDARTNHQIHAEMVELPRLRINPARHTSENYFTYPDDIRDSLFNKDEEKYRAGWVKIRTAVNAARIDRVRHWALWCVLQRAWSRLKNDEDFPLALLDQTPLPTDNQIQTQMRTWARVLSAQDLMQEFRELRDNALGRTHREQFRSCVHGKTFFPQVIKGFLCGCDTTINPKDWMTLLIDWSPAVPEDLEALLQDLIA